VPRNCLPKFLAWQTCHQRLLHQLGFHQISHHPLLALDRRTRGPRLHIQAKLVYVDLRYMLFSFFWRQPQSLDSTAQYNERRCGLLRDFRRYSRGYHAHNWCLNCLIDVTRVFESSSERVTAAHQQSRLRPERSPSILEHQRRIMMGFNGR